MAAVSTYPTDLTDQKNKLVRGDPVGIVVSIPSGAAVSTRFWRSQLRGSADGPVVEEFTIDTVDADPIEDADPVGGRLILRLTPTQSRKLKDGQTFDLEELDGAGEDALPIRTWWIVTKIAVNKDVTHA